MAIALFNFETLRLWNDISLNNEDPKQFNDFYKEIKKFILFPGLKMLEEDDYPEFSFIDFTSVERIITFVKFYFDNLVYNLLC